MILTLLSIKFGESGDKMDGIMATGYGNFVVFWINWLEALGCEEEGQVK